MKNKFYTKEFFAKLLKKKVVLSDPQLMHPEREWVIGLVVAVFIFLGAASMSAYTYFSNQSISVYVGEDSNDDVVYRESLVKEVLETIKEREATLDSLQREVSTVVELTTDTSTSTTELIQDMATSTPE